MTDKKMEIVFAPGAFDHFDGTQEELDEMVAEIQRMSCQMKLKLNGWQTTTLMIHESYNDYLKRFL